MKTISIDRSPRVLRDLTAATSRGIIKLTSKGKAVAYVLTARQYDQEDIGYMTDPEFWRMIRERRESNEGVSLDVVKAELTEHERAHRSVRKQTKVDRRK